MASHSCLAGPGFRRWALSRFRYARAKLAKVNAKFLGKNKKTNLISKMEQEKLIDNSSIVENTAGPIDPASVEIASTPKKLPTSASSFESPPIVDSGRLSTITEATSMLEFALDGESSVSGEPEVNYDADNDAIGNVSSKFKDDDTPTVCAARVAPAAIDDSVEFLKASGLQNGEKADVANCDKTANEAVETAHLIIEPTVEVTDFVEIPAEKNGEPIEFDDESIQPDDKNIDPADETDEPVGKLSDCLAAVEKSVDGTSERNGIDHETSLKEESIDADISFVSSVSCCTPDSDSEKIVIVDESTITIPESQHAQERETSCKVVSYHIDADLYVRVKEEHGTVMYKVCSALIAAASPVWRKMIYGGLCPRPDRGKWITDMVAPEDNAYGLDIVFSIIHYKFHEIPERPDIDQLYGIARVVEKYGCSHVLIPYMRNWVAGLDWHVIMNDHSEKANDDDKTMYLTWAFGEGRWFSRVVSRVAYKATVDENGTVLDARGQPWKNQGLPAAILDMIATTRTKALKEVIASVSVPYTELLNAPIKGTTQFCRSKDANEETKEMCQLQQLGSLIKGLTASGMLPFPQAEQQYKGSVQELAKTLEVIKVSHFKLPGVKPHQDTHGSCGIQHIQAIREAKSGAVELTGYFIQELKERAKKSGAFSEELFRELKGMEERNPSPVPEEDLREDGMHYKQMEDFVTAPDYYSESFAGVVIKVEDVDA